MAELYAKPYEVIDTGYNPQQTQQGGQDAEMQSYLESLPPEERQKAIERINAPLSGEELAVMAQSGQKAPTLEEYAEIEKYHKNQEISFIDGLGKIAEGGEQVMTDLSNAMGSFFKDPSDATSKMPATAVEAFAQGTRNFYGMLAQSGNPDSTLFRVKDFLNGSGTIEDRYNQYMEALKFNKESADLAEGKMTMVMDKDMINHEVTQAMAYIADPTLFIPFGKVASSGLRAVGLGEKLALAGARSAAIKNGIIGNTLKWGAGQPLEFMGGAVRNTIDYGLEKAGAAFEATTGVGAKEFAQTARMSGIGFSASAVAGHAVPYASTISDAYLVGSSAKGFGEALTLVGETMKNNQFGRGVRSWAAESLKQAEKNGVALSPHAKGLLKTLDAVDPLFAYGWNGLETASEGALIGGGLGYLSGGEEGMYSGIGAGIALGAVGGTAGKVVADVTGGTNIARRAVQAKMTIEGHKVINPDKSMFFQAMQKAAEVRGKDVDLVNSIIIGIDEVAPNFEFHALTPEQFFIEAQRKGYNPETGKFRETSALDVEFGGDRASKSKAMYVLRSVGADFVGNRQGFLDALKKASAKDSANPKKPASNIPLNLRKYTDVAKTFEKLSKTQQEAVLKEIDGQSTKAKELGGTTKLREFYDALTWSEAWTDSLVKKFESDREGARKDIADMLAQETDKKGKLTSKGRALTDKLRAEGFLDKEGKLLRERNLLNADLTLSKFYHSKGAVIGREADGKTHMYINLSSMGDETFPHELFHTIMRESPMKKHFTDTLVHKLLGTVDKDGNLVRPAEVNIGQIERFFKRYIELANRNPDGTLDVGTADSLFKQVQDALTEYRNAGENKKISDEARSLLENYTEEFGAYYFSHWLMGRNRNTLFFGGELKGIEGLVERAKDSFKDFWQSKVSKSNPEFDFSRGLNEAFDRSKGLGRISAMDYYMRDMVRAASNANREVFRPDSMTLDNLRDFERSNGLRNLTAQGGTRRLNPREQVTQNIRLGKEAYKILSGLDKNLRTSKDVLDENGKQIITGRLSEAELDALVKGGIVPRAWADKVNQGYAMLDGTVSNIFSAGYLGRTEQTTDASYPRLTGKDVSFKNRKAVLFDVETKIKADGTFYTLFHTLDLAVIEQRGNHLWQNVDYRNLWNGDRAAFEADFFRYISNASKASTDPKKLDSATLFETGDGNGAKRRDVMHQMAGMALQTGDAYKHQPIAVIPEGIRHSVTTFNIDGMTMPRIETGTRYDINMGNAHKFIRENWQPAEMKQEKTPSGTLFTHDTGFKFSAINGKYSAYANDGSKIGTYGTIKEATFAAKNLYNKAQENIKKIANDFKQKEEQNRKNLQPLDEATYEEAFRIGDMFKTKRMQEIIGDSKLVRQTFDEFRDQKIEEIISGKNEQEKGAILNQLFSSEFKELIDLEAELKKTYDEFGLEARQLQEQETEITKKIVELSQEKKRLQQFSDPEARADVGILDMYGRIYQRKQEVNKRLSEIAGKMHDAGITDLNSHYYITKRFLQNFNETGKLSEEAVKFAITPRLIKAYESNFQTGKAVTFLANHGTPNHELMVSKTFDMGFLGRNTGSMSAFNATFFAGSKETSVNYVGNPIAKTWVRDFIQARKYYVKNFSPELKAKLESLLSSDTSKGVVQKVSALMANAHIEFPDDFKLKDTGRKTKEGEPIIKPQPETQLGYDIDGFLDRALEGANDEGFSIGGYEMAWNEEGKKPYLLRNIVKMENPYVHEYAKADYRDETFASVIRRAKEAGHDGVIFKNTKDGGGLDTIFASFAKNEDNKIFTLETSEDTRFAPRGTDEAGNKIKNGSEIEGRNYQPSEGEFDFEPNSNKASKLLEQYLYGLKTGKSHQEMMTPELDYVFKNIEQFTKASNDDIIGAILKLGDKGSAIVERFKNQEITLKQATEAAKNLDQYTYTAKLKDIRDARKGVYNAFMRATGQMRKISDNDGRRLNTDAERESRNTRYLQPTEEDAYSGGRTYDFNSKQFKSGFVGLYAEQNPDRVKGVSLQFMKRKDGSHRIRLTDNSKKGESADIGHITANIEGDRATLSSHINEAYRGKKLAYVVYSEMAERLRAMGVTAVDGQIVNPDGIPIKVRERIIGDTRDLYSGRRINYVEGANRIRDKQEIVGSMGGVDVTNTLYKQARYQPAEDINTVVTGNLNDILRTTGGAYHTHNITGLIEQYIHRFKGGDIGEISRYVELKEEHKKLDRALSDSEDYYNSLSEEQTMNPPDDAPLLPETIKADMEVINDEINDIGQRINDSLDGDASTSLSDLVTLYEQANELQKHAEKVRQSSKGFQYWDSFKRRFLKSENKEVFAGVERVFRDNEASKLPKLFVSELFSKGAYEDKGLIIDILKKEGKLNRLGEPVGEINPQRLINLLRNKAGSGNKAFTEAQAIGFIDWLKLRMGGVDKDTAGGLNLAQPQWALKSIEDATQHRESLNLKGKQNTIPTREVIDWLDKNQLDVRVDRKPVPNVDSDNYVAGGETEGYRDLVIRMPERYSHGVEGHFGAGKTNVVAHVRVTFRRDAEGRKVMHIEEIQANNANVDVLPPKERETYKQVLKELAQAQLNYEAKSVSDVGYFNLKTKADKEAVGAVTAKSIEEGKPYGGKPVEDARKLVNREKKRIEDDFQDKSRWANLSFKKFEEYVNADFQKKYPDVTKYLRHIYDRQMAEAEWRLEAKKSLEKTKLWNNEPEQLSDVDPKTGIKYPAMSEIGRLRSEIQSASEKEGNKAPLQDPKEWIKLAFRTILREATVEGVDRVTITPYDKTPMQVGMNKDSAKSLYEKIIPQYFESELAKVNQKLDIKNKNNNIVEQRQSKEYIDLKDDTQKKIKAVADGWDRAMTNTDATGEVFRFLHAEDSTLLETHASINGEFNRIKFGKFKDKISDLAEGMPSGNNRNLVVRAVNAKFQQMNHYANWKFSDVAKIDPFGESASLVDRSIGFDMTEKTKELGKKSRPNFQPAEYTEFKSEQSAVGRIMRNAKGYVITMANNKFRVYNPAKAIIGVYGSEEEAKKRIYREIPKQ